MVLYEIKGHLRSYTWLNYAIHSQSYTDILVTFYRFWKFKAFVP
jgi:hypothetical protein